MIDSILVSLNWLAFVAMFAVAISVYEFTNRRKWSNVASFFSAIVAFVTVAIVLVIVYIAIGFPGWMRWPAQLVLDIPRTSEKAG